MVTSPSSLKLSEKIIHFPWRGDGVGGTPLGKNICLRQVFSALAHNHHLFRSRKKVRAEKRSNHQKSQPFFVSNFFPPKYFWFIWKQRCYKNGKPLILKPVPYDEEWNDKIARIRWNWQRKSILKWIVTVLKNKFYVKINQSP